MPALAQRIMAAAIIKLAKSTIINSAFDVSGLNFEVIMPEAATKPAATAKKVDRTVRNKKTYKREF
jgi:hypothetical protein